MELSKLIGFNKQSGLFVVGSHDLEGNEVNASAYNKADVDAFLAQVSVGAGGNLRENHELLAQHLVEPIEQVVPYFEIYNVFYQDDTFSPTEDNKIPVEDMVAMAWETDDDSAVKFVRVGMSFTRPTFTRWDAGIEVPWETLKKSGWNFLERQMRRTAEALARKRDTAAKNTLIAAMPADHQYSVSGGALTKASVDTVLKNQADIGFPVQRAVVNPGTLMDMTDFTWGNTGMFVPPDIAKKLLTTLYFADYGGVAWYTNPHVPTNEVIFGGQPNQIGWHQKRDSLFTASDVDIENKVDKHVFIDAEHAWYVGNAYTLAILRITA